MVGIEGDQIVGFAVSRDHRDATVLTDLFVHPATQGSGIGRSLLMSALDPDRPVMTFASVDPRAIALYVSVGMEARWTAYELSGDPARLHQAQPISARPGVESLDRLLPLDAGYLDDHAHPLTVMASGIQIGVAVVDLASPYAEQSDQAEVVFSWSRSAEVASQVVIAAAAWAHSRGAAKVTLAIPGPHPALRPIIDAGFRITGTDTFMATPGLVGPDPARITFLGDILEVVE
jgi:hypothetical protein